MSTPSPSSSSSASYPALLAAIPTHWTTLLRPTLMRANELHLKHSLVSFFLLQHSIQLALSHRNPADPAKKPAENKFLKLALDLVEQQQSRFTAEELEPSSGRTVVTKLALQLFSLADDAERSGQCSPAIVQWFAVSAVLFDATAQFLESKKPDGFAQEKSKYAKFMASQMAKALQQNVPYQSSSSSSVNQHNHNDGNDDNDEGGASPPPFFGAPPPTVAPPPPSLPQAPVVGGGLDAGLQRQKLQQQQQQPQPPPPASSSLPFASNPTQHNTNNNNVVMHSDPRAPVPPPFQQSPITTTTTTPSSSSVPSVNDMIDAQKAAKYAVSALQFYDHASAKKYLLDALRMLGA